MLWLAANRAGTCESRDAPASRLKADVGSFGNRRVTGLTPAAGYSDAVAYCEVRLAEWSRAVLDPPPLITGDDLKALGLSPGPRFKEILDRVRAAQLDEQITNRSAALELAKSLG